MSLEVILFFILHSDTQSPGGSNINENDHFELLLSQFVQPDQFLR